MESSDDGCLSDRSIGTVECATSQDAISLFADRLVRDVGSAFRGNRYPWSRPFRDRWALWAKDIVMIVTEYYIVKPVPQ